MVKTNASSQLDSQIAAARKAAMIADATDPRALSANYNTQTGQVIVNLKNGAVYSFPSAIAQGLSNAPNELIAAVEVTPSGDGLHWEALDVDLTVKGLLLGVFGTKKWMSHLKSNKTS